MVEVGKWILLGGIIGFVVQWVLDTRTLTRLKTSIPAPDLPKAITREIQVNPPTRTATPASETRSAEQLQRVPEEVQSRQDELSSPEPESPKAKSEPRDETPSQEVEVQKLTQVPAETNARTARQMPWDIESSSQPKSEPVIQASGVEISTPNANGNPPAATEEDSDSRTEQAQSGSPAKDSGALREPTKTKKMPWDL